MNIQKYTQEQLDEVKAAFTGEDAVVLYGITKKRRSILCPNPEHNDRHYGSCNLTKQGDYHCFVCGKTWSGIDFIQFMEGLKFIEAAEKAALLGGISLSPTQSWLEDRNRWLRANGRKALEGISSEKHPRLSKEDAALIGIPYSSKRILAPVNIAEDRNGRNVYMESDITGRYPDPDDDSAVDMPLLCRSLSNPAYTMSQEDPGAYAWLVVMHIDAKLQYLKEQAMLAMSENMPEVVNEADRLYRHLKKLRSEYEPSLKSLQSVG